MRKKTIRVSRNPKNVDEWRIEVLESNGYHLAALLPSDEMFKLAIAVIQEIHNESDRPIIVHGVSNWIETFFARIDRTL